MNLSPDALAASPAEAIHVRLKRCFDDREAGRAGSAPEPFIDSRGRLCVPTGAAPEFAWWTRGGIAVSAALEAACATNGVRERYAHVLALDAAECAREMDILDCGGVHLEGWAMPETSRPAGRENSGESARERGMSAETGALGPRSAGRSRMTRRQMREAGEVDLFAEVAT